MARITVEDCLDRLPNRFELTLLAAKRARQLVLSGEEPMVPWENDKCTVVALREIAAGFITKEFIHERDKRKDADALLSATDMLAQAAAQASQAVTVIEMDTVIDFGPEEDKDADEEE